MVKLSASRLKTLLTCGLVYHFKYLDKIPEGKNNEGASRGSCTHYVLECLLRKDRKERVENILKNKDPWSDLAVKRLARHHADKLEVGDEANFEMIRKFILVALQLDFYHEGSLEVIAEESFDIKTDKYHTGGFLDKTAIYPDKIKIVDYKTSKAKFNAKEQEFNLQNFFYTLAAKKKYPDLPVELEFQFLKIKDPVQKAPTITQDQLDGFELWLADLTEFIDSFSFEQAKTMAAKGSYTNGWLCGKGPGEMNAAGDKPAYYCTFKFPFVYFSLKKEGKVIKTSRTRSDLEKEMKDGEEITQELHRGCPHWVHLWKDDPVK